MRRSRPRDLGIRGIRELTQQASERFLSNGRLPQNVGNFRNSPECFGAKRAASARDGAILRKRALRLLGLKVLAQSKPSRADLARARVQIEQQLIDYRGFGSATLSPQ